jgi:uncharacterized membrane protein
VDKPREIDRFATMAVLACVVNAFATLLMMGFAPRAVAGALIGVAIVVGLVLWVRQRRSVIGRVVVTIWLAFLTGAALASYAVLLVQHRASLMSPTVHVMSLITIVSNCFALYFLWTRAASAWLNQAGKIDGAG